MRLAAKDLPRKEIFTSRKIIELRTAPVRTARPLTASILAFANVQAQKQQEGETKHKCNSFLGR
jgi:hypothetical protein